MNEASDHTYEYFSYNPALFHPELLIAVPSASYPPTHSTTGRLGGILDNPKA